MFFDGSHTDLLQSIEAIGASFAVYEYKEEAGEYQLVSSNSAYEELMGKATDEVLGQPLNAVFPRYITTQLLKTFEACRIEQKAMESELLIEYKAQERWWRSILSPIIDNKRTRIIQTCVDISEKKKLEKDLNVTMKRYEAVVESAYDGIITVDEAQNIKLINDAAKQIFHVKNEELKGSPLNTLIPFQYRTKHKEYFEAFKHSPVDSRPMQSRASVRGLRRDGTEFPIEVTISKIQVNQKIEMTAVIRDISEKNRLLDELVKAAQEDPLTNLYNRRYINNAIKHEFSRLQRYKRPFTLIMIDIDFFKKINDNYGHDCGDHVLKEVSKTVLTNIRDTDVLARWGGEEFMLLLPETSLDNSLDVAEKLRRMVEQLDIRFQNQTIETTISLGITDCHNTNTKLDDLIKNVDIALYKAKSQGRNCVKCFE